MERIQHTRLVNTQFTSNTYILSKEKEKSVWLVDPGDFQLVWEWMKLNDTEIVAGILLTHTHFDHLYGINEVLAEFPQCPIYVANEYGKDALFDAKKNSSHYAPIGDIIVASNAVVQFYNKSFSLWTDVVLDVFPTPGHSEDSVCLQVGNLLFTGDTLIYNLRTITKLRGGDIIKLRDSIELLQTLSGRGLWVCPGHNEEFELDGYDLRKALNANAPAMNSQL